LKCAFGSARVGRVIENLPQTVFDLFEPYVILSRDLPDSDPLGIPLATSILAGPPDLEVALIIDLGDLGRAGQLLGSIRK